VNGDLSVEAEQLMIINYNYCLSFVSLLLLMLLSSRSFCGVVSLMGWSGSGLFEKKKKSVKNKKYILDS
jgi:hypothetical protein